MKFVSPKGRRSRRRVSNPSSRLSERKKKVSGLYKLAPPGLTQPRRAEQWGLCGGGGYRGIFFFLLLSPPLCRFQTRRPHLVLLGDIPPPGWGGCLIHLAGEVLLTGARRLSGERRLSAAAKGDGGVGCSVEKVEPGCLSGHSLERRIYPVTDDPPPKKKKKTISMCLIFEQQAARVLTLLLCFTCIQATAHTLAGELWPCSRSPPDEMTL